MKLTFDKRAWWIGVQRVPPVPVLTPADLACVDGWIVGLMALQLRIVRSELVGASAATADGKCACPKCQAARARAN